MPADTPGLDAVPALGVGRMRDACTLLAAAARSDPIALVACSWQVFLTASALLQVRHKWLSLALQSNQRIMSGRAGERLFLQACHCSSVPCMTLLGEQLSRAEVHIRVLHCCASP